MKIFKTILIGGIEKERLIQRLENCNIYFNEYAKQLFSHPLFTPNPEFRQVRLVKLNSLQLGLSAPSTMQEITRQALSLGLEICPLSLGAFLRPRYLDQPHGPYLTIASVDLGESENQPSGFYLRYHEEKFWLRGYYASPDYEWPLDHEFIFIKPK